MCYLKYGLDKLLEHAPLNIDGDAAPGKHGDIRKALAERCTQFEPIKE